MNSTARGNFAWLLWLGALVLMLALLGLPPVQRTQEARVLETAREMLGRPMHDWLIPHLNGQLRLEKPPLAYWLAGAAFEIGGVSEGVGRVPFALFGWGTLIVTYSIARRLFDRRTGFFAAAALLSGMMFARHARLAETDILAVFFVTAAIGCILRADGRQLGWLALSGAMMGGAILAKGLPFIFAIVFLIALAAATRDWRLLWRWIISGAPILLLVIGLPWFKYVDSTVGLKTIADEADIGVEGQEHKGAIIQYLPQLLEAVAPWTALMVLAAVLAVPRWRDLRRVRVVIVWALAIMVPLCIARQRQYHYLLPLMPALAVLTGWLIEELLERDILPWKQWQLGRLLLIGTIIVLFAGGFTLPFVGRAFRGMLLPIDWMCLALCVVGTGVSFALIRRDLQCGAIAFAIAAAITMTVLTQAWMPTLAKGSPRDVAAEIRAIGPGPYYFYGQNVSTPTLFYLKQICPRLTTAGELLDAMAKHPDLIVIAQTKSGVSPPPVPEGLERAAEIKKEGQMFEVYRLQSSPARQAR